MSFIQNGTGTTYAPGWFLAHEECTRETRQIAQTGATTAADGSKYVKMGTLYTTTTGEGASAVTDYIGFVYEDVDVSSGNMPGSVVTKGTVYTDRLPVELTEAAQEALEAKGFIFTTTSAVTRPNWTNA